MSTRIVGGWVLAALLSACNAPQSDTPDGPRPQQAGQPMDPARVAAHMLGARAAAVTGDQAGVQRSVDALSEDVRRAMKLADASRPIDHEAARALARALPGVRSANWMDRHNLLVRVDGAGWRTQATIDALCVALEPLGDTLAVVVNLQDADPTTRDGMDTLSRNCQLAPGDHALMQRPRTVDALDPALRARHRADVERMRALPTPEQTAGDRAALEAMAEM